MVTIHQRRPWSDFAQMKSTSHMRQQPLSISPEELVDMSRYRVSEALQSYAAYAQEYLLLDSDGRPYPASKSLYASSPREKRLNKFCQAYRSDVPVWLHKAMADIVVDAASFLYRKYEWASTIYDGLRTVDGAYLIYSRMQDSDVESGIFAPPGLSAHNKGMAADIVMYDKGGVLVDMGGHFDHLDMATNSRTYTGLPAHVLENRIRREIAFQHAALMHGRLFAPLRSEFWDERFPENSADHWRVLDSIARCLGRRLLSEDDEANRRSPKGSPQRHSFEQTWEQMDYEAFCQHWHRCFNENELRQTLELPEHIALPPAPSTILYHGDYNPLYDRDLRASSKHLTDVDLDLTLEQKPA